MGFLLGVLVGFAAAGFVAYKFPNFWAKITLASKEVADKVDAIK
jgi:hypothetical protein